MVNEGDRFDEYAPSPVGDIAATSLLASAVGQQPVTLSTDPTGQVDAAETHVGEPIPPPREYAKSPLDKALLQAEASGGSDTDSGRKDGSAGHARSNSVKKPTSFKAVSVTKSFLAKVVTGAQVARPGEKGIARPPTRISPAVLAVAAPRPWAFGTSGLCADCKAPLGREINTRWTGIQDWRVRQRRVVQRSG